MGTPFKMKGSPLARNFKIDMPKSHPVKPPTKEQAKESKGTLEGNAPRKRLRRRGTLSGIAKKAYNYFTEK